MAVGLSGHGSKGSAAGAVLEGQAAGVAKARPGRRVHHQVQALVGDEGDEQLVHVQSPQPPSMRRVRTAPSGASCSAQGLTNGVAGMARQ